jgi:transcription elongation factor GreA
MKFRSSRIAVDAVTLEQIVYGADMSPPEPEAERITPEGLVALRRELHELETEGRRAMGRRILAARELGDLRENAEYHIAKNDQAHLETRIKRLRQRLRNAVVTETPPGAATFGFGQTAEVLDEGSGELHTWTIVGPTEASLSDGRLSAQSPVGKALVDCAVGELVDVQTPRGSRRLRIQRIV